MNLQDSNPNPLSNNEKTLYLSSFEFLLFYFILFFKLKKNYNKNPIDGGLSLSLYECVFIFNWEAPMFVFCYVKKKRLF